MTISSRFAGVAPDFTAVVLASTVGSRLFPLTNWSTPKHVLPLCGAPLLIRLLESIALSHVVVAISSEDLITPSLLLEYGYESSGSNTEVLTKNGQSVTIFKAEQSEGSVDVLRQIHKAEIIPTSTKWVVLPADILLMEPAVLDQLTSASHGSACTMLLTDVGSQDENGIPLKESAKAKKGGLARSIEEIEYIGLSYPGQGAPRVVAKQLKLDVEEDRDMTGATPKFMISKDRLRGGTVRVRTDWNDVHAYVLSPWVIQVAVARKSLVSIQEDLIPLLISRQFRGVAETLGSSVDPSVLDEILKTCRNSSSPSDAKQKSYSVLAHVASNSGAGCPLALRCHTVPAYLYTSKELVHKIAAEDGSSSPVLRLAKGGSVARGQSVLLEGAQISDKVTLKSTVIGRNCKIGSKCRLNQCVILDNVTVGDNCILQNSIVAADAVVGDQVNLNDCQVGAGQEIPNGTKEKGETFLGSSVEN